MTLINQIQNFVTSYLILIKAPVKTQFKKIINNMT